MAELYLLETRLTETYDLALPALWGLIFI